MLERKLRLIPFCAAFKKNRKMAGASGMVKDILLKRIILLVFTRTNESQRFYNMRRPMLVNVSSGRITLRQVSKTTYHKKDFRATIRRLRFEMGRHLIKSQNSADRNLCDRALW